MSEVGHNSAPKLQEYVGRLTKLEEDKKEMSDEIRDLKIEAKSNGLDPKALAAIVKRQMETADQKVRRVEYEGTLDTYLAAMNLLG